MKEIWVLLPTLLTDNRDSSNVFAFYFQNLKMSSKYQISNHEKWTDCLPRIPIFSSDWDIKGYPGKKKFGFFYLNIFPF